MTRDGLRTVLCVLVLLIPAARIQAGDDRDAVLARKLAVQTALQKARDLVARNSYEGAIFLLEGQIDNIEGSREYLTTLRNAYRSYVQELRLANRDAEAQVYERRLRILDPGYSLEASHASPAPSPATPTAAAEDRASPTIRGQMKDEEVPHPSTEVVRSKQAQSLLAQAQKEFDSKNYDTAASLFEQADRTDSIAGAAGHERLAYCKLFLVVQQLKQPSGDTSYPELALQVRRALDLAPPNSDVATFGKEVLGRIEERRATHGEEAPALAIRYLSEQVQGWSVAETANFRVLHNNEPRELVEKVASTAEKTRADMQRKWFGRLGREWNPKCDIVLHATAADYSRATEVPPNSPGHSTMKTDKNGKLVSRRIDLHCDDPNMVHAVLPHEATHCVLAGNFNGQAVPRWADEGMAVLSEPRDKIDRHLRNLPMHRQDGQIITPAQLMEMREYPEPRQIGAFYAQSVSTVEFLVKQKDSQTFTEFLRDGLRDGYESALRHHYGFRDFRDLEKHWSDYAFTERATPTGVAEK